MSLERDFEEFTGGPNESTRDRMHVTIRPSGDLYFNANTHRILGRPDAAKLYYSRARDTIAIAPANPRQKKNFPVVPQKPGFRIRLSPFCGHYRIRVKETQRFAEAEIDASGHLILDLGKTVNMTSKKQAKDRG